MIITVAFDVKNHVDVMEGWPIKNGGTTFFLERKDNVLERVCLAFSGVGIEHAPNFTPSRNNDDLARLSISGGVYAELARKHILNWQAVVSGLQIVDIDYDNYELRFHPESVDEEPHVHVKSFKANSDRSLNSGCDFEQLGRAFCVGPISDDRIESTSHFREGRLAFEAGRYVDAYNNMFLFLETRYCDGKTKTAQQIELLSKEQRFCESLERTATEFAKLSGSSRKDKFDLVKPGHSIREKITALVLLRGKLRHHSLKSPHRWDPNKQKTHEISARFLGAVVADIVIKESIEDIYDESTLKTFRDISVNTGFETKIKLTTYRLERERTLSLDMSYPTTVISSKLCLATVRNAIEACMNEGQLPDTVRFEAAQADLELFSLAFDVWAYTPSRSIQTEKPIVSVRCSFEHLSAGAITNHAFSIPVQGHNLTISDVWRLLQFSFDHIEKKDPTTRIMSLKMFLRDGTKAILTYRVGAIVKH